MSEADEDALLFERRAVEESDRLLIESRCTLCGFCIVGSVMESLKEDEQDHALHCPEHRYLKKAAS